MLQLLYFLLVLTLAANLPGKGKPAAADTPICNAPVTLDPAGQVTDPCAPHKRPRPAVSYRK